MNPKFILLAILALLLCGCPEEDGSKSSKSSKAEEAARIEAEVQQRVAVVEKDLRVRQQQLHTIRVVSFVLLAGGAVGGLVWLQRYRSFNPPQTQERHLQMPGWLDHYRARAHRVLELPSPHPPEPAPVPALHAPPAPQDPWTDNNTPPRRRRATRRRHRNRNRNHNYDETPRDS